VAIRTTSAASGKCGIFADSLSTSPAVRADDGCLAGVYVFYAEWDEDQEFLPARQAQFGLKLEPGKAPLDVLTIDRV